jgi:hypothetical protein
MAAADVIVMLAVVGIIASAIVKKIILEYVGALRIL